MIAVRQMISIRIDVVELIVESDRLGLVIGLQQRPLVPERNIADRVLVCLELAWREVRQRRVGGPLDAIESIRASRKGNVALEVRRLELQLARLHDIFLDKRRKHQDAKNVETGIAEQDRNHGLHLGTSET